MSAHKHLPRTYLPRSRSRRETTRMNLLPSARARTSLSGPCLPSSAARRSNSVTASVSWTSAATMAPR